eukprot:6037956-Pleurochrysis_carterae.AAC.2
MRETATVRKYMLAGLRSTAKKCDGSSTRRAQSVRSHSRTCGAKCSCVSMAATSEDECASTESALSMSISMMRRSGDIDSSI